MQISKKSWLYDVAYGFSEKKPEVTNLCNFFWRTVFMLVICWPAMIVLWAFLMASFSVCGFLVDGTYPNTEKDSPRWIPYKHWPMIGVERVSPIGLLSAFFAGFFGWRLICVIAGNIQGIGLWLWKIFVLFSPFFVVFGVIALVMTLIIMNILFPRKFRKVLDSEFYKLTKEYVLAKKQKICPIIHFTD